jgi:cytochrome c5
MRRFMPLVLIASVLVGTALGACATEIVSTPPAPVDPGAEPPAQDAGSSSTSPIVLEAEPQRPGDPEKGYHALVNEAYVPCGIPWSAYEQVFGAAPESARLPGREGRNETLPYYYTAMTTKAGVEIVTANCLNCHAGYIDGELVVGLGAAGADFTRSGDSQRARSSAVGLLVKDPAEREEWTKWRTRVDAIADHSVLSTRGVNPADNFTAVLFAHHDPVTLAWSDTPLLEVPPPHDTPVDVPPWWHMKKKASMFYVGGGRGDHARIMMTASILCTSSVEESEAIDAYFTDVRAYIANLEPPKYPWPIDDALAERGRTVFEASCARCHGTYGDNGAYPNLLFPLAEIGTDPVLASGTAQFAPAFVDWFAKSFFGQVSRLEPKEGYVAPPLDGIWATAPFLHNGSVPTIAALLDSSLRPKYWTRTFDTGKESYDRAALGWKHTVLEAGKDAEPDEERRKDIYDTTLPGYGRGGHLYGDVLTPDERTAVIEYLKTL